MGLRRVRKKVGYLSLSEIASTLLRALNAMVTWLSPTVFEAFDLVGIGLAGRNMRSAVDRRRGAAFVLDSHSGRVLLPWSLWLGLGRWLASTGSARLRVALKGDDYNILIHSCVKPHMRLLSSAMMTPMQSKMARVALGWSTSDLADKAQVGKATVSRFET